MFEQILQDVKDRLGNDPAIAGNIPPQQADEIHQEIATHIHNGLQDPPAQPASEGILAQLEGKLASGDILTSAIAGGLVGSLGRRFGLSSAVTGAIAASLPGLIKKYAEKKTGAAPAQGQARISDKN